MKANNPRFNLSLLIIILVLILTLIYPDQPISLAQDTSEIFLPLILDNRLPEFFQFLPMIYHHAQPPYSTSYYLKTVDATFLYDLGCELGLRDQSLTGPQDSVAVLDFSYPICNQDVVLGAELFGFGPVSISDIGNAARNFGLGYFECSGTDTTSTLVVGVGTNNKPYSCDTIAKAQAHGIAWAEMVNDVNNWFIQEGLFQQVQAYAASDMELGWNTPTWTRAWLDAYDTVNAYPMLHFGDASGCPYDERPYLICGSASYPEWENEDVWYISWGAPPALPLPLIYLTNGIHAKQWAFMSQYSVSEHGARMDFTGVFTQYQACQQWGCTTTDNTPEQAYTQLSTELNKNEATSQYLRWKTDIRWILNTELRYPYEPITSREHHANLDDQIETLRAQLQNVNLSALLRNSLEEKLIIYENMQTDLNTSIRNAPNKIDDLSFLIQTVDNPPFQQGIFYGGDSIILPLRAIVNNYWQTETEDGYLQIVAGQAPIDADRGAIYIVETSADWQITHNQIILAPADSQSLTILEATPTGLRIQSKDGQLFMLSFENFDLYRIED